MKKLLSVLLALTMLFMTACGTASNEPMTETGDTPSQSESESHDENIYTMASGIPADKTVMRVGDNEIPAAMYLYWAMSSADNLLYQLQMYYLYYGMYADVFGEDGSINWDAQLLSDQTLGDHVAQQTQEAVGFYAAVENLAAELGVTLTEEDRAAMAEQRATVAESYRTQLVETDPTAQDMTADELIEKYLTLIGIDETLYERISGAYYLFQSLQELVVTEGSALYLEDADCNEYGYYADHILLATVDTTTNESLSEQEITEKRALAEKILARLENSSDPLTLFAELADEYSEDPGRASYPTGYIFTPGTMVSEFENAADALEYGEISGIVESSYGYHIILRRDVAEGLEQYPEEKEQFAQEHLLAIVNLALSDSDVVYDEVLTDFDYGAFYDAYTALTGTSEDGSDAQEESGADTNSETE